MDTSKEVCVNYMRVSAIQNQQKQALIRKNYNEIYAHELAHKNAGGSLAGPIVIEKNQDGIPVGGHVSIKMPKLNKNNPEETIQQANIVMRAALAPGEPSEQDKIVASQARKLKSEAEDVKTEQKLDFYA